MGAHDQAIASAQRALALAAAGGEVVLQALANRYLGRAYQAPGRLSAGDRVLRADRGVPRGRRRHERFGQVFLPAVFSRAALATCHAELGRLPRAVPSAKKGSGSPRRSLTPAAHGGLLGARSAVPPPRRSAQSAPPARTGRGHLSGRGLPGLLPPDGCSLGCGVHPSRARRRRRAAAHAGAGPEHGHGNSPLSGALSSLSGGGAGAGRPPGGGVRPRRARAGARPRAPGTGHPGVCPAPPR